MLKNNTAFSSFSVDDIEAARQFYGQTLGLELTDQMGGLELHTSGNAPMFIYSKPDHTPATFTILNFLVSNIDEVVGELKLKGVVFEHYDSEYMKTDDKGIARGDNLNSPSMAWFKDPAGNFLSVIEKK
jgi:catechol 2,3-dioxygenase-like lactoylglutathione lyase family enzyme